MNRRLAILAVVLFILAIGALFLPEPAPVFPDAKFANHVSIASPREALTFARSKVDGDVRLLAVTEYRENSLSAIDLTELFDQRFDDPVELFNSVGYEAIEKRIEAEPATSVITVEVDKLILPLDLTESHVAAGTNFAAHADESSVEDGPFLFAKLVVPTPFNASVKAGDRLLDYEAELAYVTLSETLLPDVPRYMGLILANDFTDRAKLLRHLDPDDVTSGDGFTTGKSSEGFLPVGNLLVIPRDFRSFSESIELKLAVNEKLRQQAGMTLAIWDIEELFRQIQAQEKTRWMYGEKEIGLPVVNGALPARTLILAGTPEGTVFAGIPNRTIVSGLLNWATGGWDRPLKRNVIESYIDAEKTNGRYLQAGDEVEIRVENLGVIRSGIQ